MAEQKFMSERLLQGRLSRATGVVLTLFVHAVIVGCCFVTGFTYLDPPPPERNQILIEFEEVKVEKPKQTLDGTKPKAPEAAKELNLVQQSEAHLEGTKANEAPEATVGEEGDVEVPEQKREKEINRRALFSAANNKTNKDTLAAQTAEKVSDALKGGHALGNTKIGETYGAPKADLEGRTHNGTLPKPSYSVQASGKVVVEIWVDNYGTVTRAVAGAEGTTVTDKKLWQAARKAAMEASFNMSADAPPLQKGTITYIFKLK